MDLDAWNRRFGGPEGLNPFEEKQKKGRFEFAQGLAYSVRVTRAQMVKSDRGQEQLRLILDIMAQDTEDAEVLGSTVEHFTLPWQQYDNTLPQAKRETVLRLRVGDLKRIFSAAVPSEYAPYWRTEPNPAGKPRLLYLDFDGQPLDGDKYGERQDRVNEAILEKIAWLKDNPGAEVEELAQARFYMEKRDKPDSKYPYVNLYSQRPKKVPVMGDEADYDQAI